MSVDITLSRASLEISRNVKILESSPSTTKAPRMQNFMKIGGKNSVFFIVFDLLTPHSLGDLGIVVQRGELGPRWPIV